MDRGPKTAPRGDEERLLAALEGLHRRAMGISMPAYGRAQLSPLPFASIWAGAYILVVAALLGLESGGIRSDPRFVGVVGWGLVYSTAVMFFARLATLRSFDIVRRDILPYATPAYIAAVAHDLERRDTARMRWIVPLLVAIVAAIATSVAQAYELPPITGARLGPVRLFWAFVGFYLSFVAARGVLVGRFYEPFAQRLDLAQEKFYVLGAAETPLVRGVGGLARQMLILWVMIFLAILSIMLLGAEFVAPTGFRAARPSSGSWSRSRASRRWVTAASSICEARRRSARLSAASPPPRPRLSQPSPTRSSTRPRAVARGFRRSGTAKRMARPDPRRSALRQSTWNRAELHAAFCHALAEPHPGPPRREGE